MKSSNALQLEKHHKLIQLLDPDKLMIFQVVEDDSSILSRYPHRGFHANHINTTKFGGPEDAGYIAVRGKLCVWAKELGQEKNGGSTESAAHDGDPSGGYREPPNSVSKVYGDNGKSSQANTKTGGGTFTWDS